LGNDLRKIILYGSYARGDYCEESDVDIMILSALTENENDVVADRIYDNVQMALKLELALR
jgi:predicted nucleotidyltransferase